MPGRWWGAVTESNVPELASAILDPRRTHPIIVVTTPGYTTPGAIPQATRDEAEALRLAVGDVADVAIVATGDVSFALEAELPPKWHIFNGFCRSYPAGILADPDIRRSPLRRRRAGEQVSERVISDALGQAQLSGVFDRKPEGSVTTSGIVQGFLLDGEQALVDVGAVMPAVIWRDLTSPGIPLDWLIAKDATVPGELDRDHTRFLLRRPAFGPADFLDAVPHGAVTLALVDRVEPDTATLRVHPDLAVTVHRSDVTSNPLDVLDLFLVEGEVVRVRAIHLSAGAPHLRLSDVDEDEPVIPAVPVVEGGTPWLIEGRNLPAAVSTADHDDASAPADGRAAPVDVVTEEIRPVAVVPELPAATSSATTRPTPRPPTPQTTDAQTADAARADAGPAAPPRRPDR